MSLSAFAQKRLQDIEPELIRMHFNGAQIGAYEEYYHEETSYTSGDSTTYDRRFDGLLLGLGAEGSLYHPNLFQFNFGLDVAAGETTETITSSRGSPTNHHSVDGLGNIFGNATLLGTKPYSTSLFVNRDHGLRDYDFFNRATVDSLRYGLNSGYRTGPVPINVSLSHQEEETSGLGAHTAFEQNSLSLNAHNDRERGRTAFRYSYDDYLRKFGSRKSTGVGHSFGVSDRETLGARKNIDLNNSLGFATRESTDTPSQDFSATSDLTIKHRPNFKSLYNANYYRNEVGSVVAENSDLGAGVEHRLFASLTSGLRVRVSSYSISGPQANSENNQFLGTWSEFYTKRLSESARLSIGGSLGISHAEQKSSSVISVVGEAHSFNSGGALPDSFFLNLLNANEATIEVFSQDRSIHYVKDADYSVSVVGAQTMIRLIQPSPNGLTSASQVIVDYKAAPQGSGSTDGLLTEAQIRLDLFNGMWGFYSRYNSADYKADAGILVQNVSSIAFGTDFTRKWLRAGAEYQIYDATFSRYDSLRLYQTMTFKPDDAATLTLNFSEGWADYKTARRTEQFYTFITQYHRALTRHLGLDFDAGATQRFGRDVDQFQAAVRPGISYTMGKLTAKAGYDFEYLDSLTQQRVKHMVFARISRSF